MFCLHPPSRARHSVKSARETFYNIFCRVTISDLSIGNLVGPWTGALQAVSSCGLNLQTNHDLAIGDLAIGDLAVECFDVHAIESLDFRVHVATNFVKMLKRKKIAGNKSSNFDSAVLISLAILCRMVSASSFHSSEYRNLVFLALVEDLWEQEQWVCNQFMGPH